jgi:hypothetical protein
MKKNSLVVIVTIFVVFLFLLFPACSFAGDALEPLKKAERPTWQVGDTWIYQVTLTDGTKVNKLSMKMSVVESGDKGYTVVVDKDGEKTTIFYNSDLNVVRETDDKGDLLQSYEPEMPSFKWPLKPGQWWKGSYFSQGKNKQSSASFSLTTEVVGAEALISADGKEVATIKLISKRENQGKKIRSFVSVREFWYDPQMRFIIKRVDDRSREQSEERNLISFTPGGTK